MKGHMDSRLRHLPHASTRVILLAAALLVAGTAAAGWLDRGKNARREDGDVPAHRFDHHPTLAFRQGTLEQDAFGGWRLGDVSLQLARNCLVTREGALQRTIPDGETALVAGSVVGNTIIATHIMLTGPQDGFGAAAGGDQGRRPSDSDPSVGVLEDAPR